MPPSVCGDCDVAICLVLINFFWIFCSILGSQHSHDNCICATKFLVSGY
uniref:Uncharacterized protein n=1 Tax=Rhizophora mucronata TaxID=61149 RepID=A0A2P2PY39_RHIMU